MLRRMFVVLMLFVTTLSVSAQDAADCPDVLPTRLSTGNYARVSPEGGANRVRSEPTTSGSPLGMIPAGGIFWVHDGPECADGYRWWYAEYRGLNGWTVEATDTEYWLEPVTEEEAPILNIEGLSDVIVYTSETQRGDRKIFVSDMTGEVSVSLTPPGFEDISTSVSPDYTQLAFLTYDETERRYYLGVMGFDGSFRRTVGNAIPSEYAWSPDSRRLAINIEEADPNAEMLSLYSNIYTISPNGGEPRRVTNGLINHSIATWSPDGTQLAYIVDGEDDSLWVMNLDSGEEHQILSMDANLNAPQWSPDGSGIAFSASFANDPGFYQYFVVNPDGSNLRQPTGAGEYTVEFEWSPDGSRIAFASRRTGSSEIFVVNADGSGLTQVTQDEACALRPSWSPDGQALVFVSNRDRERQNLCVGDVYVINIDGSSLRRLTDNARNNFFPQWVAIAPPLPPE